jgi:hypothetical protein
VPLKGSTTKWEDMTSSMVTFLPFTLGPSSSEIIIISINIYVFLKTSYKLYKFIYQVGGGGIWRK